MQPDADGALAEEGTGRGLRPVHVVDDERAVRNSLVLMLRAAGVDAQAHGSGEAFLRAMAAATLPDLGCVLLDIRMPGMDGLAVLHAMEERGLQVPTVVVTAHADVPLAVAAMKAGACDFIEKPYTAATLLEAVRAALRRGAEGRVHTAEAAEAAARVAVLTPRERDVLRGMVAGWQNKVIAIELGLSPRTVEVHRANAMAKLRAGSLSEAVRLALAAGFAS